MNKKVYITIILICLIITLAVVAYLIPRGDNVCAPYKNIEMAVKSGDISSCSCLVSQTERSTCRENILGASSYTSALSSMDISKCNSIESVDMKNACINVVQGKIDYAQKAGILEDNK